MIDMKEQLQKIKNTMVESEMSVNNTDVNNKENKENKENKIDSKVERKENKINSTNKTNYNDKNNQFENKQLTREIRRGQIWWADIDGNKFSEQGGKRYPVICLSNNIGNKYSPTIIIAFITSKLDKPKLPTHTLIEGYGLPKNSVILLEQIRTIDKRRLVGFIGAVDEVMMRRIDKAKDISMSELKPKTTFERLDKENQQFIINKLNIIKECNTVLKFLNRVCGSQKDIGLAEDEKFEAENALMSFCYQNSLNPDEFYTQENGVNKNIAL